MAVVVQSSNTTAIASQATISITKPTGLAVGDLLVAQLYMDGSTTVTGAISFTSLLATTRTGQQVSRLYYKIADAADVAKSTFDFVLSASDFSGGGLMRITGHNSTNPIAENAGDGSVVNTATPSFANTITPHITNSLLLMFTTAIQGVAGASSISGYAITTSNPTWTEIWDSTVSARNFACAAATRSQITATGNSSVSGGDATTDWTGQIVAIAPPLIVSPADTQATTDVRVKKVFKFFSDTETAIDSLVKNASRLWSKVTKNISTWVQGSKNT